MWLSLLHAQIPSQNCLHFNLSQPTYALSSYLWLVPNFPTPSPTKTIQGGCLRKRAVSGKEAGGGGSGVRGASWSLLTLSLEAHLVGGWVCLSLCPSVFFPGEHSTGKRAFSNIVMHPANSLIFSSSTSGVFESPLLLSFHFTSLLLYWQRERERERLCGWLNVCVYASWDFFSSSQKRFFILFLGAKNWPVTHTHANQVH